MGKRDGKQQGAQNHAEGQHGNKTRAAKITELQRGSVEKSDAAPPGSSDTDEFGRPIVGSHRLKEDRQQHDEAEKNSEANRLRR